MRRGVAWVIAGTGCAALVTGAFFAVRAYHERGLRRESHTVAEAVKNVAKLSTVEMSLSNWQLRRDEKPLFGVLPIACRKSIAVMYKGKVSAGFDLQPATGVGLDLTVDPEARRVRVRLPAPRLLYTEVPPPELVVADGSVCNAVTPDDYARLHEDARHAIQKEAVAAGILGRAEAQARALFEGVVRPFGYALELQVGAGSFAASAAGAAH